MVDEAAEMDRDYRDAVKARFRRAVIHDHADENGCNNTCDITAALRAGFPRVAAYLLSGATEAPWVEGTAHRYGETWNAFGHSAADDPDWLAWIEWFHANTIQCPACEAYCFTDRGTVYQCGNCAHDFPDV